MGAEFGVAATEGEEFVVASAFNDPAVFEDEDLVGVADRGEAVSDDEAGALDHEAVEGFLDEAFRLGIDAGGGFIEDEDGGIFEESAGDGDALFFADAEFDAAFTDDRAEAFGEAIDEFAGIGGGEGGEELVVGGEGFTEEEIFADGAIEEEAFLGDHPDGGAEGIFGEGAEGALIDEDFAVIEFVEAGEEVNEGGFAGAGLADEGDGLASLGVERDVMEDGEGGGVSEANVFKFHIASDLGGIIWGGAAWFCWGIEDFEDAFTGGAACLDELIEGVEFGDGIVEGADEPEDGDEIADGHLLMENGLAAEADDEDGAASAEEAHGGIVECPDFHDAEGGLAELMADGVEAGVFLVFADVGFDLANAREIIVEESVHRGGGFALESVAGGSGEGVEEGAGGEEGDGGEGEPSEVNIVRKEHGGDDDDLEEGDDPAFDAVDQNPFYGSDILEEAGHDIAGGAIIEPGEGELLDVGVEVATEVKNDLLFEGIIEDDAEAVEGIADEKRGGGDEDESGEAVAAAGADVVDDDLGDLREDHYHESGENGTEHHSRGQPRVATDIGEDAKSGFHVETQTMP